MISSELIEEGLSRGLDGVEQVLQGMTYAVNKDSVPCTMYTVQLLWQRSIIREVVVYVDAQADI